MKCQKLLLLDSLNTILSVTGVVYWRNLTGLAPIMQRAGNRHDGGAGLEISCQAETQFQWAVLNRCPLSKTEEE